MTTASGSSGSERDVTELYRHVVERIARREPLSQILTALCHLVEQRIDGSICSIMRLDPESGVLTIEAAPCLPPDVVATLDNMMAEALIGVCGVAASTGELVVAEDTRTDPHWVQLRPLVEKYNIGSCWSVPVFAEAREGVLGTFGVTRHKPGAPTPAELATLKTAGHLAGIALSCDRLSHEAATNAALLRSVIEGSKDQVSAKDAEGRYLLVNSTEAESAGCPQADMIGKTDAEIYNPTDAAFHVKKDRIVMETGETLLYEQEYSGAHGEPRRCLVHKSPLLGPTGAVEGVIALSRDVTEWRRAEAALRRRQKLESLGVLAGGIAHDFNNLLTGILGRAGLAERAVDAGSPLHKRLVEIQNAAERGAELTQQLLAYAGRAEGGRTVVSLTDLIAEAIRLIPSSIVSEVDIRIDAALELPAIEADETQLRQVLINLMTNAADATAHRDDRWVEVRVREWPAPSPAWLRVEVSDNGCGMDSATTARIFDPFFTTKEAGRGLGLAAVEGIVLGHGGAIDVESELGRGTTFVLSLPATTRAASPSNGELSDGVDAGAGTGRWTGTGTVLVIDDEDGVRRVVEAMLEQAGLRVLCAADGAEGIALLRSHGVGRVDLVLLDVTMPGLNGADTFERLREIDANVPVMVISGHAEHDARPIGDGRTRFLAKPFRPDALIAAVRACLEPSSRSDVEVG